MRQELRDIVERAKRERWMRLALVPSSWFAGRSAALRSAGWPEHAIIELPRRLGSEDARALSALASLTSLDLSYNDIGADGAQALSALRGLTSLYLPGNGIGDVGAQALCALTGLISLDLSLNEIGADGVWALSTLTGLKRLHISRNGIGADSVLALSALTELTSLDLFGNGIGADGATALSELTGLTSLDLSENKIGPDGARALSGLAGLTRLKLSFNEVGTEGAIALSALRRLTSLELSGDRIGADGAKALSALTGLTSLVLSVSQIGDEGAQALSLLTGLTSLDLANNQIGREGARALSTLTRLTHLDLSQNEIGEDGARALSVLTGLASLDLANNQIGDEGARALSTLARLTHLDVSLNKIGDDGARALSVLTGLAHLDLWRNDIGGDGARALSALTRLASLNLSDNALTVLPEPLVRLENLKHLHLGGNAGLGISEETLKWATDPAELWTLYQQARRTDAKPVLEAKAVMLGEPGAGKSWLRCRLSGIEPPPGRRPTHSYQRARLAVVAQPQDGSDQLTQVGVTLFDFGGDHVLHGTHRFFMASLRNIFVVCANAEWSWEKNNLDYWLNLIRFEHERQCRLRDREHERLRLDGLDDARLGFARSLESGAKPRHDASGQPAAPGTPPPPVIVVLTHSRDAQPEWIGLLEEDRLSGILGGLVRVVDEYDSGPATDSRPRNLEAVEDAMARCVERLDQIWSVRVPPPFEEARRGLVTWCETAGSWMWRSKRYAQLFRDEPFSDTRERDLLLDHWLLLYRDIGLVHWFGDWPSVRKGRQRSLRDRIFNPDWVKKPIYNLHWDGSIEDAVASAEDCANAMRAPPGDEPNAILSLSDEDEAVLLDLLEATGLCLPLGDAVDEDAETGPRLLIPDHLKPAPPRAPEGWTDAPVIESGRYRFLPSYAIVPLVASRYAQRLPEAPVWLDRIEIAFEDVHALVRIVREGEGDAVEIRVRGADATARLRVAGLLRDEVERTIGWGKPEWRTLQADDKGVDAAGNVFRRVGKDWEIRFEGTGSTKPQTHCVPFLYLRELLSRPNESISPIDLEIAARGLDEAGAVRLRAAVRPLREAGGAEQSAEYTKLKRKITVALGRLRNAHGKEEPILRGEFEPLAEHLKCILTPERNRDEFRYSPPKGFPLWETGQ